MESTRQADGGDTATKARKGPLARTLGAILAVATAVATIWGAFQAVGEATAWWQRHHAQPEQPSEFTRTPRLGLEFWQGGTEDRMSLQTDGDRDVVRVAMRRQPFELRFPKPERGTAVQICAWVDDSIFVLRQGGPIDSYRCFRPGTGMADYEYGSGALFLDDQGHNYLVGTRVAALSDTTDKVYFANTFRDRASSPLQARHTDLYLAVLIDANHDGSSDLGEYEYVVLDF